MVFYLSILRHLLFLFLSAVIRTDRQKTYIDKLVCLSMYVCLCLYLSVPKKNTKFSERFVEVSVKKLNLAKIKKTKSMKIKTTFLVSLFFVVGICISCQKEVPPAPVSRYEVIQMSFDRTGATYSFNNTSQNANKYSWDFGDGSTSIEKSPIHKFVNNGSYEVRLTAEGDGGTNLFKQTVNVNTIPKTGDFIFWSRIQDKGNITVNVSGSQVGIISVYQIAASVPACGTTGFVTVTLSEGIYSFTAKSQGLIPSSWTGTFQVINGTCRNTELLK